MPYETDQIFFLELEKGISELAFFNFCGIADQTGRRLRVKVVEHVFVGNTWLGHSVTEILL